jgi:hypothetical protein
MKRATIMLALCGCFHLHTAGQSIGPSTLNAQGGSGAISGKIIDWSVGEMTMVSTFTASNIVVTQGVLQPPPQQTGVNTTQKQDRRIVVYPNPAETAVFIKGRLDKAGDISISLYDMNGKLLSNKKVHFNDGLFTEELSVREYAAGNYLLNVHYTTNGQSTPYSFNISKIK